MRTDGPGTPAKLHLGRRVASVDPATATITFKDGSTIQGDVVLGADGVGVSNSI
jgi:2-polyprenyl-6-methoxyphenol hydroxylase-like FAD-dependent oxidoreductase